MYMKTIYMDESGYTGFDLLNCKQPFQGASCLIIDEINAQKLIENWFPRRKSIELKHKKLSKYKKHWKPLLEIQQCILDEYSGVTYICDKRYLLILQFLDDCVEPFCHKHGINFFQDGQNYALASLLYHIGGTLWGAEQFEDLLYLYQRASRNKTELNVSLLIDRANSLIGKQLSEFLVPLASGDISCIHDITRSNSDTDIVLIVVLSLINYLEKIVYGEYIIIHDTSDKLTKYGAAIERLIGVTDVISFRSTSITSATFPLRLSRVDQKDSISCAPIQLADLLIGAVVEHYKTLIGLTNKNDYNQEIINYYSESNLLTMLPSLDFQNTKKFRKDNQSLELIDFISNIDS